MTGQEATNVAKGFNDRLGITGVILTKLDGDTRGGAALSIHNVTGAPIKFVGVGEKLVGARAVLSGSAGVAHSRDGRRADADREDAEPLFAKSRPKSSRRSFSSRASPSTIFSSRCDKCASWDRSTIY